MYDNVVEPALVELVREIGLQAGALHRVLTVVAKEDFGIEEEAHVVDLLRELIHRHPLLLIEASDPNTKLEGLRLAVNRNLSLLFADRPELAWSDPGVDAIAGTKPVGEGKDAMATYKQRKTFSEGAGVAGRRRYRAQIASEMRAAGKSWKQIEAALPRPPIPESPAESRGAERDWRARANLGVLATRKDLPGTRAEPAPTAPASDDPELAALFAKARGMGISCDPVWRAERLHREIAAREVKE